MINTTLKIQSFNCCAFSTVGNLNKKDKRWELELIFHFDECSRCMLLYSQMHTLLYFLWF